MCEDARGQRPSARQEGSSQQEPNLQHLDLGLPGSRTVRNTLQLFKPHLPTGSLSRQPALNRTLGAAAWEILVD